MDLSLISPFLCRRWGQQQLPERAAGRAGRPERGRGLPGQEHAYTCGVWGPAGGHPHAAQVFLPMACKACTPSRWYCNTEGNVEDGKHPSAWLYVWASAARYKMSC